MGDQVAGAMARRNFISVVLMFGIGMACCVIIDPPLVFPDDFGPLSNGGWHFDDRMHKVPHEQQPTSAGAPAFLLTHTTASQCTGCTSIVARRNVIHCREVARAKPLMEPPCRICGSINQQGQAYVVIM